MLISNLLKFTFLYFIVVQCPSLDSPDNGTVSTSGLLVPGATATYTCDYGLVSGDLVRYCLADGTWSGTEPVCGTGKILIIYTSKPLCLPMGQSQFLC